MKKIVTIMLICCAASHVRAQLKLAEPDFKNLIALSELYSHNTMCNRPEFKRSADSLRTPVLNPVIDFLIATGKADTSLMGTHFLSRPPYEELVLLYTIKQVHYNRIDTAKKKPSDNDIANSTLAKNTDVRWLLHTYYSFLGSGISMLFNTADLSNLNINTDDLGLKDETEKGIFFLSITDYLVRGRFMVLSHLKKSDRLLYFARRMPMFNGKPYYYFSDLEFPDFDWSGYVNEKGTYKEVHIGAFIGTIAAHFAALANSGDKAAARNLYFNSILHRPEFFKYSIEKEMLQKTYDEAK